MLHIIWYHMQTTVTWPLDPMVRPSFAVNLIFPFSLSKLTAKLVLTDPIFRPK